MAKLNIGLKQARRVCQLSPQARLAFFAEGMPQILASAQGFWSASEQLEGAPREAQVLADYAAEEAAKILILADIVRCPPSLLKERMPLMLGWFYQHLTRLLYAEAQSWRPVTMTDLRDYVDNGRKAHYLEGYAGEYILPNSLLYQRETSLYVDIEAHEDGVPLWSAPRAYEPRFAAFEPASLRVAKALFEVSALSERGLAIMAEVWGPTLFRDDIRFDRGDALTEEMLRRLFAEGLPKESARDEHVQALYAHWQMPMYDLEFALDDVPFEELDAARERMLAAEMGWDGP